MVVEFVGVPGSGKSTIAQKLQVCYEDNKRKAVLYKNPLKGNIAFKIICSIYILSWCVVNIKARNMLIKIIKLQKNLFLMNGTKSFCNSIYLFKILVVYHSCMIKKNSNVIIVDQGILQYVLSSIYKLKYSDKLILDFVKDNVINKEEWYIVFCNLNDEEIIKRLNGRTNGKSRIEKLPETEWENAVKEQLEKYNNIKKISLENMEKAFEISTKDSSPVEIAQIILKKVD
jgi:hypothetical protein